MTFVSRANSSNCKHNLDSTRPDFFFIGSVTYIFRFHAVSHKFTGGYVILLLLRNFVSVCSQKLPKCNKPDNRHAASKFRNFTTIANLTLVELEENGVWLFVCLGARAKCPICQPVSEEHKFAICVYALTLNTSVNEI